MDPIEAEIAAAYAEDPGLSARLDEMERQLDERTLKSVPHEEMRRRAAELTGESL